ncbi:RsiG family protein [Kineococcus indalonis]|uniref:RsiG family protein n=1 Tax=Kineococcus indalonis TaxID=2696566 RepID=UPI001413310E|nr:aerial mycelium formation protein [Kineococcus indalonis]NAZ87512.1 aerial mycelium formation protein [Kineococcus indalonis]
MSLIGGAEAGMDEEHVSGYQQGGRRALDKVLAPKFTADLRAIELVELRERRSLAEQEEADLSYARRLLQGRLDLLGAELQSRSGADGGTDVSAARTDAELVARLTDVLADPRRTNHGMGRHTTVQPSRVGEHRRRAEAAVADPHLSDLSAMDDEQLAAARERLLGLERELSGDRHRVQEVMDACTEEITRRYRDGVASVEDALPGAR